GLLQWPVRPAGGCEGRRRGRGGTHLGSAYQDRCLVGGPAVRASTVGRRGPGRADRWCDRVGASQGGEGGDPREGDHTLPSRSRGEWDRRCLAGGECRSPAEQCGGGGRARGGDRAGGRMNAYSEAKSTVRREALERLRALTTSRRRELAAQAMERLWRLPALTRARSILLYASLPEEMPTDLIAFEARRRGLEVIYPRTVPEEPDLYLHRVASDGELRPGGGFGIRE